MDDKKIAFILALFKIMGSLEFNFLMNEDIKIIQQFDQC
jgi:hypothetical protein